MSELLNLKEAAAFLRLSRSRLYELAQEGRIPARQIGGRGRLLFMKDELERALTPKTSAAKK